MNLLIEMNLLKIAQLQIEKCELKEARKTFLQALTSSKNEDDPQSASEALAGLLGLAAEALDDRSIEKWEKELDRLIRSDFRPDFRPDSCHNSCSDTRQIPPLVWFCKGVISRHRKEYLLAQRHFHRYLKALESNTSSSSLNVEVTTSNPNVPSSRSAPSGPSLKTTTLAESNLARGWIMLATVLQQRGRTRRSLWFCKEILRRFDIKNHPGIHGATYLILGTLFEQEKNFKTALFWFHKAHAHCLREHNWFSYLYALYGHARVTRKKQRYSQATEYLDLMDKAASGPEFALLRQGINAERLELKKNAFDLLVDSRKGIIATRESGELAMGKQFILLQILEVLSEAHKDKRNGSKNGLSKAELIEKVWKETYRPESHDSKVYYNINRLRKLIEPDVRRPHYLLNWREGYRLAPDLQVLFFC